MGSLSGSWRGWLISPRAAQHTFGPWGAAVYYPRLQLFAPVVVVESCSDSVFAENAL